MQRGGEVGVVRGDGVFARPEIVQSQAVDLADLPSHGHDGVDDDHAVVVHYVVEQGKSRGVNAFKGDVTLGRSGLQGFDHVKAHAVVAEDGIADAQHQDFHPAAFWAASLAAAGILPLK